MKRRLIKQGGGGFTIYLPKKWVDERQLKAGDEIDVDETENALVLRTEAKIKKEAVLQLDKEDSHFIYLKLSHIYRMGYDKIIVHFKNSKTISDISKLVIDYLLGFEVTEKGKNYCVLENVTEPTNEKFSVLLRRIFLQLKETYSLVFDDIVHNTRNHNDEIQVLRISFDKHIFFCRRCISKKMNIEENSILHWELLTLLMHSHHGFYYLYQYYYQKKIIAHVETKALLKSLGSYLDIPYNSYFEKSVLTLDSMQDEYRRLQNQVFLLLEKHRDPVLLAYLKEIIRLLQVVGSPVRALLTDVHTEQKL
ncbi:MAG: hypothetical protein WC254_00375 [Candidatus Woesearchaeota archaeon]